MSLFSIRSLGLALACLLGAGGLAGTAAQVPAGSGVDGQKIFETKGCYQCHGWIGQGAAGVGPTLHPSRLTREAFAAYVRKPGGEMPHYNQTLLSQDELQAIIDYLSSLPKPRSATQIPILARYAIEAPGARADASKRLAENALKKPQPPATKAPRTAMISASADIYQRNCGACHGARFEGGAGPSLKGIGARKTQGQVASLIRNPPPRMPPMVPGAVADRDVPGLAAYLRAYAK